jgi:hypothetical protein
MTPADLTDERVDASLRHVFDAPPFSTSPGGSSAVLNRAYEGLVGWYQGIVGNLYIDNPIVFWLAVLSLSALAALLLSHIAASLWSLWRSLGRVRRATPGATAAPSHAFAAARLAYDEGDYRLAVELAWSSVATAAGSLDPTDTPRRHAVKLRARLDGPRAQLLIRLVATHERACYAGVEPHRALAESALRDAALLLQGGDA